MALLYCFKQFFGCRLVATLKKYFELAVQKEVPLEIAGKFVSSVTTAFTSIFEFDADYPMDDQVNDVLQLVATIIRFINEYPYGEAYVSIYYNSL